MFSSDTVLMFRAVLVFKTYLGQKIHKNEAYRCLKSMIRMSKDEEMRKNERNNVPRGSRVKIRPK